MSNISTIKPSFQGTVATKQLAQAAKQPSFEAQPKKAEAAKQPEVSFGCSKMPSGASLAAMHGVSFQGEEDKRLFGTEPVRYLSGTDGKECDEKGVGGKLPAPAETSTGSRSNGSSGAPSAGSK